MGTTAFGFLQAASRVSAAVSRLLGFGLAVAWMTLRARGAPSQIEQARLGVLLSSYLSTMGGAYIKFGQLLAARGDLLPPPIASALLGLLDEAPPELWATSCNTICVELSLVDLAEAFADLDPVPIGAGSFATVYRAQLAGGDPVAVKVRRAGVEHLVRVDLATLKGIAAVIDMSMVLGRFRLRNFVASFSEWTWQELDYGREAAHITQVAKTFSDDPSVFIPRVERRWSTRAVLVTSLVTGDWLTGLLRQPERPLAVRRLGYRLFEMFFDQVFGDSFFHADPHAGNFCLMQDGRLAIIDFGLCASAEDFQDAELELHYAIRTSDFQRAFGALLQLTHIPPDANVADIRSGLAEIIRGWNLAQIDPVSGPDDRSGGALLRRAFSLMHQHGVVFRRTASPYYRAFYILDGLITQLNPDFSYAAALRRYFARSHKLKANVVLDAIGSDIGVRHLSRRLQDSLRSLGGQVTPDHHFDWDLWRLKRFTGALSDLSFVALAVNVLALAVAGLMPASVLGIVRNYGWITALVLATTWLLLRLLGRAFWIRAYDVNRWLPRSTAR